MHRTVFLAMSVAAALSGSAVAPSAAVAQYGPDTCREGFVWREAFRGDHVCVRPWVRDQTSADNAAAASRIYGNGRCVEGYVWREAFSGDHVCVTPAIRERGARDTERAPYRRAY
jgi:hypothetical protein